MQVTIVTPAELSSDDVAAWRRYQNEDPLLQSPYCSPDFVKILAETRPNISVAVIEEGRAPAGFFAFRRCGNVGRPPGGALDDCQAVIGAPGWDWDIQRLIRACGLSVYEFTHIRAAQRPFVPFHRAAALSHVIDLSEGFDAYGRDRRTTRRKLFLDTEAKARRLSRRFGTLRFAFNDVDPQGLRILLDWKDDQYRRLGLKGFSATRWSVALLERLHATKTDAFAGVLSTLYFGDRLVAVHMGMRSETTLHHWFPAYDRSLAKFSPGLILLYEMCRAAPEAGIRQIELGVGHEDYKMRFANDAIRVAAGFVGSPSLPLWTRQFLRGTEILARRLPVGRVGEWPGRLLRRMAQR